MSDTERINNRIDTYSEAFDFYIERREMPPEIAADDQLGAYMRQVIDENPHLVSVDPLWAEVLKENLMDFFQALLQHFAIVEQQLAAELAMINRFRSASIEQKRRQWSGVVGHIKQRYTKYEVNIDGYSQRFDGENNDAVFAALTSDWESACRNHAEETRREMLARSKHNWAQRFREIGDQDYIERRKIEDIVYKSPVLSEIVDIIGRARDADGTVDNLMYSYLPKGLSSNDAGEGISKISFGNDIERVTPSETLLLSTPDTEQLFYQRYALRQLQQFSAPSTAPLKTQINNPLPRPKKGPIIVAVDTSGSMYGRPEQMAKSLLIQLVRIARAEHRSCYLITFSVRIRSIDLGRGANMRALTSFLQQRYTGGNGEEKLLIEALRLLESDDYGMADVLIISDFIFNPPDRANTERVRKAQSKGTRFYGLQINSNSKAFDALLDRKWKA
ncbi:hypothetical protein [Paramuribaculum intestinale]|uniref:hypothetical protein n=1 Tax=Paramuribaculum intestinale TaxID=2094151 RepID=UPI00267516AC|nr:hypothetical protein [Paramuribaculum intestinale]